MRLELKHLVPYLPYQLLIMVHNGEANDYIEVLESLRTFTRYPLGHPKSKPILRPMSDLTQEELREAGFGSHVDYLTHELQNPANKNRLDSNGKPSWRVGKAPHEMVEYLFENKFDVFGLIDADLAIDKKEVFNNG
jgi:hypothetical protein